MLVNPNLTKPEYMAYMSTCKALIVRIEEEQEKVIE